MKTVETDCSIELTTRDETNGLIHIDSQLNGLIHIDSQLNGLNGGLDGPNGGSFGARIF